MQSTLTQFADVAAARAYCTRRIDTFAAQVRGRHVTIAPGQDGVYIKKEEQARRYLSEGGDPADFQWIAQEAARSETTLEQTCQRIIAAADAWNNNIGPLIESIRVVGKADLATKHTVWDVIVSMYFTEGSLDQIHAI